jgi:SARP family transcriptional regulator, regulator of embCAB operon
MTLEKPWRDPFDVAGTGSDVAVTSGATLPTRIHLCGHVTVELDGRRLERDLPGRQGRLLFVYLAAGRARPATRAELLAALWPDDPPAQADSALSSLLSKLRRTIGAHRLEGRSQLQLQLPPDAWIDLEAATAGVHEAEGAVARRDWHAAWGPARVAQHIAARGFLEGEDAPWIDERRRQAQGLYLRSLELAAQACLGIGGAELVTGERTARTLIGVDPYREAGYRLLMELLVAGGNRAQALLVYDELRRRLHDELAIAPSEATQSVYRSLL